MVTSLPPGEPAAGPWRVAPLDELADLVLRSAGDPVGRPRVVAVDGRGASGKSTLAARLHAALSRSAVVATDDIAWNHSFFDWADLVQHGVVAPVHRGQGVSFRPPGWEKEGRPGAVEVPAGLDVLLLEGVGAGRVELAPLLDAVVWVQSDAVEAERRRIARDIASGVNGDAEEAAAFWHEWMAEELVFLRDQRPWERACVIVAGTTSPAHDGDGVLLAPPPTLKPVG